MAKDRSENEAFARYRENQRSPKGMRGVSQTGASSASPAKLATSAPAPTPLPKK